MSDSLTPSCQQTAAFYRRGTRCFGQREDDAAAAAAADNEGLLLLLLNGLRERIVFAR